MMTYTAAIRAAELLARDFTEGADIAVPMVREDMRRVIHSLIGDQTGAFRACCEAFEDVWTAAGGTFAK